MDSERPTPLVEDVDGIRRKLEAWFSERRGSPVTIGELNIPEGTRMSNVTLLFDIQWQEGTQTMQSACVGRLQPQIERPVFADYDLSLQYQVMTPLQQQLEYWQGYHDWGLEGSRHALRLDSVTHHAGNGSRERSSG